MNPAESTGSVNRGQVRAGESVTTSGGCFVPGATLTITVESTPIRVGTTQADASGNYSVTVVIPASVQPGNHHIVVTGLGRSGVVSHRSAAAIQVLSAQSGGTLVRTGYNALRLAFFGAGIIALGAAFRTARRRPDGAHFS